MSRRVAHMTAHFLLVVLFCCATIHAQEPAAKTAQGSIESWLSLIDSRSYAASWESAASIFKSAVTRDKWQAAVQSVRGPLGQVKSRVLKNGGATTAVENIETAFAWPASKV